MEYVLPKDLMNKFETSLKTIYNYVNKYKDDIRSRKELGKTVFHLQDFTTVFQKVNGKIQSDNIPTIENTQKIGDLPIQNEDSEFQKLYNEEVQKNEELNKVLDDKSRQLVKYGELYMEVKGEKKELENKYDNFNNSYFQMIQENANNKVVFNIKYHRLLIFIAVLITMLLFVVLLYSYPEALMK